MISGETLIEKFKTEPKTIRKILYILRDAGILTTRSIPDPKTRFLEFFWETNLSDLKKIIENRKAYVKEKLDIRLEYEQDNYFFTCNNGCNERINYADAIEFNVMCQKCNKGNLVAVPNEEIIVFLNKIVTEL